MALKLRGTKAVTLIGAPADLGAGIRGAALGPQSLRSAGLEQLLRESCLQVVAAEDVRGPGYPDELQASNCRCLSTICRWCEAVRESVGKGLARGYLPVLLGGDHSLSIGSIAAVAHHCAMVGKQLFVIWLDAHADFNTPQTTPSGNVHGMPVAVICGDGPEELIQIGHRVPIASLSRITLVGVRSIDDAEAVRVKEKELRIYSMAEIHQRGMSRVMADALAPVLCGDSDFHLHVSFDVDFIDPAVAPGVGTRVPGGPGLADADLCFSMIGATGALGSMDVVEFNPAYDHNGHTAGVILSLLKTLFEADWRARNGGA